MSSTLEYHLLFFSHLLLRTPSIGSTGSTEHGEGRGGTGLGRVRRPDVQLARDGGHRDGGHQSMGEEMWQNGAREKQEDVDKGAKSWNKVC